VFRGTSRRPQAPRLGSPPNGWPSRPKTGLNYELTNIVIGEPSGSVVPPPDAVVEERQDPRRMGVFPLGQ
jgi:hypothetical protein